MKKPDNLDDAITEVEIENYSKLIIEQWKKVIKNNYNWHPLHPKFMGAILNKRLLKAWLKASQNPPEIDWSKIPPPRSSKQWDWIK